MWLFERRRRIKSKLTRDQKEEVKAGKEAIKKKLSEGGGGGEDGGRDEEIEGRDG